MKIIRVAKLNKNSVDINSPEFKEWFGDWSAEDAYSSRSDLPIPSQAIKDGKPQVMYHGTTKDFEDFEVGLEGYNSNVFGSWKVTRNAIFFTPNPVSADAFTSSGGDSTGGNIRPAYLNVRSPLDLTSGISESVLEEFEEKGINPRWLQNFGWDHFDGEDGKHFIEIAKDIGYDGILFSDDNPETREEMETWAIFEPSQIMSVYK